MQIKKAKVFLSYASEDEREVEQLYNRLLKDGLDPWMSKRNIHPGEMWEVAIWRAIKDADFVVICLSEHASAKRGFLQKEIKQALEIWKEKLEDDIYLIPVKLRDCSIPNALSQFHWVDLQQSDGYQKLLRAISIGMERYDVYQTAITSSPSLGVVTARIEDGQRGRFLISIEYPLLQPSSQSSAEQVNARLETIARECSQLFRTEWTGGYDPEETSLFPSLEIRYGVSLLTDRLFSVNFDMWSFHPVAMHPNANSRTFNFLLAPFTELHLMDLFQQDSKYLKVVSEYCIRNLHDQRGKDTALSDQLDNWIVDGAGPRHQNFERFLLTTNGLTIVFDAYQVASYAEGRFKVEIPMPVLNDILKPEVLAALNGQ